MPIPLVDIAWQHRQVRAELDRAFDQLLTDPTCDSSALCKKLEGELSTFFGEGFQAISVQSGLAAEFLALKALGIGRGDEVITVPNSDMATTATISHTGATFVLVDVEEGTHNINPALIEAAITPRTRAIVPVHMYGLPAEMDAISAIARKHKLLIVEDATLSLGATYNGQKTGTFGDAACFSFAPGKVIGSIGNGGVVVTKNPEVARKVKMLKSYGLPPEVGERPIGERHLDPGMNNHVEGHDLKMDGIQAAVVSAKFAHLGEWATLRQAVAERYRRGLSEIAGVTTPFVPVHCRPAWRNYVITVPEDKRDRLRSHLRTRGITTSTLYTPPVHRQEVYRHLNLGEGSFPVTERLAKRILCLPLFPGMSEVQVDEVVEAVGDGMGARD